MYELETHFTCTNLKIADNEKFSNILWLRHYTGDAMTIAVKSILNIWGCHFQISCLFFNIEGLFLSDIKKWRFSSVSSSSLHSGAARFKSQVRWRILI